MRISITNHAEPKHRIITKSNPALLQTCAGCARCGSGSNFSVNPQNIHNQKITTPEVVADVRAYSYCTSSASSPKLSHCSTLWRAEYNANARNPFWHTRREGCAPELCISLVHKITFKVLYKYFSIYISLFRHIRSNFRGARRYANRSMRRYIVIYVGAPRQTCRRCCGL